MQSTFRKYLKKVLRILSWFVLSCLVLFFLAIILLRTEYVQNQIKDRALTFIQSRIKSKVDFRKVYLSLSGNLVVEALYVEDQSMDTLLFAETLSVDVNTRALLHNRIDINLVTIKGALCKFGRSKIDSVFNFDFIVKTFSGNSEITTEEPSKWTFGIKRINIYGTEFAYDDLYQGNVLALQLGDLDIEINNLDFENSVYDVESIIILNTSVDFNQNSAGSHSIQSNLRNDSKPLLLDIRLHALGINNLRGSYNNDVQGLKLTAIVNELNSTANKIDLGRQLIDISNAKLKDSFVSYQKLKGSYVGEKRSEPETNSNWKISLDQLEMNGNSAQYYAFDTPKSETQFDANRIWIYQLNSTIRQIEMQGLNMRADIQNLTFRERCGLSVNSCKSNVKIDDYILSVQNFRCETDNSHFNLNSEISLNEFFASRPEIGKVSTKTELVSEIGLKDVTYFVPIRYLDSLPVYLNRNGEVKVQAVIRGEIDDLDLSDLELKTLSNTDLVASGKLRGLSKAGTMQMDLTVDRLYTTSADVEFLLRGKHVDRFKVPDWIELKGTFKGPVNKPKLKTTIASSDGNVSIEGALSFDQLFKYDLKLQATNLMIGKILLLPDFDVVSLKANVKGSGVRLNDIDTELDINIAALGYKNYVYKDFNMNGVLNRNGFSGSAKFDDENLSFELRSKIDYEVDTLPVCKLNLALKNADFKELHLFPKTLKARGGLAIEFSTNYKEYINFKMSVIDVTLFNGKKLYKRDSLFYVDVNQNAAKSAIAIRSEVLTGGFRGTFNLFDMPRILKRHFNRYFSLNDSSLQKTDKPQKFSFDFEIRNSDLLTTVILPDLKPFLPGSLHGEFDSKENLLTMEADLAKLQYSSVRIDSISLRLKSDKVALRYSLNLRRIGYDTLQISGVRFRGRIENDSIRTGLIVLDSLGGKVYSLVADLQSKDEGYKFHLLPERVVLNRESWTIPSDNYLILRRGSVTTNKFYFSKGSQKFEIVTSDSTLMLGFEHFPLSNFTGVFDSVMPADGQLNGDVKMTSNTKGNLSSDLSIRNLTILGKEWGTASIKLKHRSNVYDLKFDVNGTNVNLQTSLTYNSAADKQSYSGKIDIDPFDLALIEPLSLKELKNVKGSVTGNLDFTGSFKGPFAPNVDGKVTFKNAQMLVARLNSKVLLKQETIAVTNGSLTFVDFRVNDENDNLTLINGTIHRDENSSFGFNLNIHAKDFQVLNTSKKDNQLYYGLLKVDANAKITGNSNNPRVKASFKVADNSNITYVVPETERTIFEQKGIVKFVSKHRIDDPFLKGIENVDTTRTTFSNLILSGDLTVSDDATLNIVIDPVTEDKLSVNGNSTLLFDMNGSGNINLSGRYEVTKGYYNFSFHNLAKRQFIIEKGGSIVWSGDPMNAAIDLKASYELETSPLDLVYNQINTTNQSEINAYNQRLPFIVYLIIQGKLLTPQISFLLDMPDNKRNVMGGAIYAKLQDINTRESDLNKQVFALMILKRFLSDTPFDSKAGSGLNNTARASVSRILSEQLNRLSENVKGIKLNVDIKSYENYTGNEIQGQTKLQLGVSKTLLNDRLVVKLSGNVDIEGQKNESNTSASDYIGDLALEYKLTSDGRLRITGFRNSNFDVIDGGLTETGAGLIYIKDYNTLKELFTANAKEK